MAPTRSCHLMAELEPFRHTDRSPEPDCDISKPRRKPAARSRVVSEQDRSRLYAWLCDQVDKPLAEYVMSCLAPAPLSDLVTRDFLSAELAQLAAVMAAQREADRAEAAELREVDRKESTRQFRWLIGTFIGMTGVVVSAVFGAAALA